MICASDMIEPPRLRASRWMGAAIVALLVHTGGGALAFMHWQDEDTSEKRVGTLAIELAPLAVASLIDMPDMATGPLMQEATPTPQAAKQTKEDVDKEIPPIEQSLLAPNPEVVLPIPRPKEEKPPEAEHFQEALPETQSPTENSPAPLTTAPPRIEAKQAPVAAAPAPGLSVEIARVHASWEKSLVSHLNHYKRYPPAARARGEQGVVGVRFVLDRGGQVISSSVARSSGSSLLDEEALAILQRASPLPAPPSQVAGATFDLTLPIHFRIR